jgi:hypothetical protein
LKLAQKIRTQETNKQMKTIRTVPEIWELWKGLTVLQKIYCLQRQLKEYRNCSKKQTFEQIMKLHKNKLKWFIESTKTNQKTILISSLIFLLALVLIVGLFRRYQFINKTKKNNWKRKPF